MKSVLFSLLFIYLFLFYLFIYFFVCFYKKDFDAYAAVVNKIRKFYAWFELKEHTNTESGRQSSVRQVGKAVRGWFQRKQISLQNIIHIYTYWILAIISNSRGRPKQKMKSNLHFVKHYSRSLSSTISILNSQYRIQCLCMYVYIHTQITLTDMHIIWVYLMEEEL